jgi:alpha-methylacyl-CoA racemase
VTPPLSGLRILDCSRLMPFGYGTQLLTDSGAEVIKVEMPGGEYGRGMAHAFRITNRGKKSITLNLQDPGGARIFVELSRRADAVFESFRPGFMERLGLGYEELSAANPALVYCSATGYGQTGEFAHRPGHDANYAALAGLLKLPGEPPMVPHLPYVDMVAGWAAAHGLLVGILQAKLTGRGCHIDVSMTEVGLSLNTLAVAQETSLGDDAGEGALAGYPWPDLMLQRTPSYGVFETADGEWVALANSEPKFWNAMLDVLGLRHLESLRFAAGDAGVGARAEIAAVVASRSREDWDRTFDGLEVCYQHVNTPAEAVRESQFASRGAAQQTDEGEWAIALPMLFSGNKRPAPGPVPAPGEHNAEIYAWLGYGDELSEWQARGLI